MFSRTVRQLVIIVAWFSAWASSISQVLSKPPAELLTAASQNVTLRTLEQLCFYQADKDFLEESLASCKVENIWWKNTVHLPHSLPWPLPNCYRYFPNLIIATIFENFAIITPEGRTVLESTCSMWGSGTQRGVPLGRLGTYQGREGKPKSWFSDPLIGKFS